MKTTRLGWNVKKLNRTVEGGNLNFNYPIQRAGGQWDVLQKSLLIHSLASDYPVPPVLFLGSENTDYVLDGKQRITNILDFISGLKDENGNYPPTAYKLDKDIPTVTLDSTGREYELENKYFDELDEDIQSEILGVNLSIQRLEDATDEEIEELFYRWNNGTPLTKQQKSRAKMGVENATIIDALQKHPFMQERASFTALQRRRSDDEAVILQTMMLMSNYEIPSNGFVADNILKFATEMRETDISNVAQAIKDALDYAYSAIDNTNPLLKKLHLPTLLVVAKKALDEGVATDVFGAWVIDFNNAINGRTRDKALVKTNYKNYTGAGSVKRDKVLGRNSAMITHFNGFIDRYEPVIKEIKTDDFKQVIDPQEQGDLEPKVETVDEVFAGLEEVMAIKSK